MRYYLFKAQSKTPVSKEAQVKAAASPAPKQPKAQAETPKGKPASPEGKQGKYGQKAQHVDKKRYPKRPNNAIGETKTTWVIPFGQKPVYNKKDKTEPKEEGKDKKEASSDEVAQPKVEKPAISTTDHAEVVPVDNKATPKVAEESLLGAAKPNTIDKDKAESPKDIISDIKSGNTFEAPDGSKIYSKKDENGEVLAHVAVDKDGKKKAFYSDEELHAHLDKLNGGKGAGVPSAEDHKKKAEIARAAGHTEIADKQEKLAAAKAKMAELGKKEEPKKPKKTKEEKDIAEADKIAAQFRQKLIVRNKKNKEKEAAKLDKQKNSKDEKVVKEARKELKAKAEERARRSKEPDTAEGLAAHALHTSKAKETLNKVDELLADQDVTESDKTQLAVLKNALNEHSKQKHEPNGEEKRQLGEVAKLVNHMHGARSKDLKNHAREQDKHVKIKVKEEANAAKEAEKKYKEQKKQVEKEAKESAKKKEQQAKDNPETMVEANIAPKAAKDKVGLGAFHSGRAVGASAATAAGSESGGSLGAEAIGGTASGAASIGHKLLGGDSEEDRKHYIERKKKPETSQSSVQTVSKSLWYNEPEESTEPDSISLLKSFSTNFRKSVSPVTEKEFEFLARECGYSIEQIYNGQAKIKGRLESRYAEWLCKSILDSADDLCRSLK